MKPFLIAEIGINHNGDLEIAKRQSILLKKQILMQLNFKKEILILFIPRNI